VNDTRKGLWPEKILGPAPGLKEINVFCWGLFVAVLVAPLCVFLWVRVKTGAKFSDILPVDFVYFYGIGHIVNAYPAVRLYDRALQLQIFSDIFRLKDGAWGGSPYPPFVARFFSLYARFSFEQAYFLWMATSFALYLTGVVAAVKAAFAGERLKQSLIVCFALAFPSFIYFTLSVGQLASVAVFAVGIAIYEERRARPMVSGLALSILAYKPTLLLIVLPMLLITRRWKTLAGFACGTSLLAMVSTAFSGLQIWPAYAHFLTSFSQRAGINGQSLVKRWEYIDLYSLSYITPGGRSAVALVLLACVAAGLAGWLAVLLWKASKNGNEQLLVWAVALAWTLLLNVYVPIYDSILVAPAGALTLGALGEQEWSGATGWFVLLGLLIFGVSAITEGMAQHHGIQPLSVLILLLGVGQGLLLQRMIRRRAGAADAALLAM
jgi:hypothetical protein